MRCPFLQEAHVKYCQASPFRKMIVESSEPSTERCCSPAYRDCPAARQEHADLQAGRCPFLQCSFMQYCSAASVTKYIPYSESLLSRCGNENHRYCELYLAIAEPDSTRGQTGLETGSGGSAEECSVEGIEAPARLAYSANHMWLDISEDGSCHVGVDAFFAKILGKVDKLSFIAPKGAGRPCTVISACGADLPMIFPQSIVVTRTNDYLRANPEKVISHPYTLGWLFEGKSAGEARTARGPANTALIRGKAALDWMRSEVERISRFIHDRCAVGRAAGETLMMDGGTLRPGFVQHLDPEEVLVVFNEFFAF